MNPELLPALSVFILQALRKNGNMVIPAWILRPVDFGLALAVLPGWVRLKHFRACSRRLGSVLQQPQLAGQAFEPGADRGSGGNQRQAHCIRSAAHQMKHRLHRPWI
jgi:hypothetical protein